MMAYHQRYNQFRSRIDFDDPSTTKPQSLAKSAVLQALEEEERQQSRANKGWQRPSRSRHREEPAMPRPNSRTPCIDRDTVMRINRRPVRHRSCDNFWPPAPRTPSPLERTRGHSSVGESEGGSFAYDGVRRYGSNESVYFDVDKVCKQHKIDPLRTKFDKANVVLVDWGRRGGGFRDNGSDDKRCREKADDTANNSINRGKNIESEKRPSKPRVVSDDVKGKSNDDGVVPVEQKSKPPSPPPRRYFLPIDQLHSGVGVEILLRCYKLNPEQDERLNDSSSQTIDNYQDKAKAFNPVTVPTAASIPDGDGILHQDGIQSKPPLKTKSTSTKRTILSSKPPTPVHFSVSPIGLQSSDNPVPGERNEFNINSDTILNLNIDTGFSRRMPPQITVTECRDQTTNATTNHFDKRHSMGHQQQQTASLKTSDQLLNEIIDENHNYNEKLITNSGRSDTESHPTTSAAFTESDRQCRAQEFPNEQHSKLNVSNQPNRNWINLNSNEIHPYADGGSSASTTTTPLDQPAAQWGEDSPSAPATSGARMTQTRVVLCNPIATEASDTVSHPLAEPNDRPPKATHVASDDDSGVRPNYDNKSVKSNYWDPIPSGSKRSEQRPGRLERSDSRDSSRSWRFDEVLEFPPPPPYLCLCEDESIPSGRCSEERSTRGSSDSGAQICDNRNPTTPTPIPGLQQLQPVHSSSWSRVDNPTISQSCRQDSTSSTVPAPSAHAAVDVDPGQKRWDDNRAAVADIGYHHQLLRRDDDYFKTNLTDDKFLSENVNIASNLGGDQWGQQRQLSRSKLRPNTSDDPRGCNRVNRFHMAPSIAVQNFDPLHKSIDAFLAAEREASPMGKSIMTTKAASPSSPPPVPPPPQEFENSARFVSFTDGEFIFGPYDARSEEFQRFDLWDGDFHKRQDRHCHHHRLCKKRSPSGTSDGSTNSSSTLCLECHCQRSSVTSSETLKEVEAPKLLQKPKASQVENYDDTTKNVPAGNHPTLLQSPSVPLVPATYERWVHFDNGNISPPPAADQHRSPTPVRIPTPYPSPTHSGEPDDQPQCHQNVFDQFAAAFDEHQPQSKPASVDFVENVPLIDAVLDDLLTFSKTLVLRQSPVLSCPRDFLLAKEREEAKIVEINDDNLINLLADDDDNSIATKGVDETGRGLASERKTLPSKQDSTEDDASGLGWQQENSGNESFPEGKCDLNANEGRTQLEPKDHNRSADDSKDVIDNYLSTRRNHEDIFANVAIFNWNPLDVYHQHGLFMIDPRFALADLHATIPEDFSSTTHGQDDSYNERQSRASNEGHMRNDAHLNSPKLQIQQDDGDTAAIGTVGITDGADPSSVDVNSFATQLADPATGDGCLLESHKIPNDRASSSRRSPAAVDHFYDSAHVEYPVRADLCSATIQECHQSPKESDYDNDPAKNITTGSRRSSRGSSNGSCSRRSSLQRTEISTSSSTGRDETEGLKRVAWPPPAELGDGEYQYQQQQPVQQPQQPYHYPPQQQQNQQPFQQQQHYQPAHTQPQQQHQPRERIIPIQRATSHTSPLHTPKSPVNQLKYPSYPPSSPQHLTHQQPQYQQPQQKQGGSSTVAFSGGRAVLPQKQQPARPVSAPYYQQQQQQNSYSSPSTASLASPRSPHPIGGGQSPRGWAHVQSPVPVYRPTPQQQYQYQQQPYVPPPFQTQPAPYQQQQHQRPTSGASAGYGHGYGPRKVHN